ncbi:hypothetical protein ACFL59_01000 [Planctomycetota bacterium]
MNARRSTQACFLTVCAVVMFAAQAQAGIPEQFVAENGLKVLAGAIKYLGVCIALSGLFVGIGLAIGKRNRRDGKLDAGIGK